MCAHLVQLKTGKHAHVVEVHGHARKNTPVHCFGTPVQFEDKSGERHACFVEQNAREIICTAMQHKCMAMQIYARPCTYVAWPRHLS